MSNPILTVFTPAFNRRHTLPRTYESLLRQSCKDFIWLIVDDGSSDGTGNMVAEWINEGKMDIKYIYQDNQGMHGAHNTAYRNIETELNVCIDSDDYMPEDAVEKIISSWRERGSEEYAGIIGLDVDTNGKLIGTGFPEGMEMTTLSGFYDNGGRGDKKLVYRTEVIKKYPEYPIFEGEKYFGLAYKYHLIDQDYKLLVLNEPLVIVDYQPDGSSYGMFRQYWNNPNGFMFFRKSEMRMQKSVSSRFRSCIHYVSHCIRAGKRNEFFSNSHPVLTFIALPFGAALYLYTRHQVKKGAAMSIS
jgi:glycosyltransferase involved in cell wall biosynthesis